MIDFDKMIERLALLEVCPISMVAQTQKEKDEVENLIKFAEKIIANYEKWLEEDSFPCEVSGCRNHAAYEGWWQVTDFSGNKTGMVQKRKVCEKHKTLLIGGNKDADL